MLMVRNRQVSRLIDVGACDTVVESFMLFFFAHINVYNNDAEVI